MLILLQSIVAAGVLLVINGCGKGGEKSRPVAPSSRVEAAIYQASAAEKLPPRLVLAAAWLESRMTPEFASSLYLNPQSGVYDAKKGVLLAQSAFGVPLEALGLVGREDAGDFLVQIEAYTKWLAVTIAKDVALYPAPVTADEKFDWVWEIAKAHRPSSEYSRNVRAIFANELIKVLNEGFTWQDPQNMEIVKFVPEVPELKVSEFRSDSQRYFTLTTQRPQIESATFLKLGRSDSSAVENHPKGIEVIHCPLTLSACLDMQHGQPGDVRLEAHYIIPQNDEVVAEPLQITKQENSVRLTDARGVTDYVSDRIVVMLVGNSGRLVDGYRNPVNPAWISKWQLLRLGDVINDICLALNDSAQIEVKSCLENVNYRFQAANEALRWGDIVDFDPLIFSGYIANPGGLQGEAAFSFPGASSEFQAGASIPLNIVFGPSVKHVEVERLVRCPDQKVVWSPLASEDVRNQTSFTLAKKLYDAGPNHNGNQFFRAKVYAGDGSLIGWDTASIYLRNFEKASSGLTPKSCATQGI